MDHTVTEGLTLEITSMNMQAMTVTTACMLSSFSMTSFSSFLSWQGLKRNELLIVGLVSLQIPYKG